MENITKKRLIVLSSPSGGGKSTVARYLLKTFQKLKFSISATTRPQRPKELHGKDYYFISKDEFLLKVSDNQFVEHEEIFGNHYGTLHSEVDNAFKRDECLLFDIDVKGAISVRNAYPNDSLLIFLAPPRPEVLEERLRKRQTESEEQIKIRLERNAIEMSYKDEFDYVVINEVLETTLETVKNIVEQNMA